MLGLPQNSGPFKHFKDCALKARFLAVVLMLVAIAGCSASPSPQDAPPEGDDVAASSPMDEGEGESGPQESPKDEVDSANKIDVSWEDSTGYKYRLMVAPRGIQTEVDTLNQKPGQALIRIYGYIDYTIKNETPGRNVEIGQTFGSNGLLSNDSGLEIFPVFSTNDAPFCTDKVDGDRLAPRTSGHSLVKAKGKFSPKEGSLRKFVDKAEKTPYCYLRPSIKEGIKVAVLGPDETHDGTLFYEKEIMVLEKNLDAAKAALESPKAWGLEDFMAAEKIQWKNACLRSKHVDAEFDALHVVAVVSEGGKGICEAPTTYYKVN